MARLYAKVFWVRYSDYFANKLLLKYNETCDSKYLDIAEKIFKDEEPDL